jgi:hypothetical protein
MCGKTCGQTGRGYIASGLSHSIIAVQIDQINRESHAKGMDSFTRKYPQPFSVREVVAPQQALPALCSPISYVYTAGEDSLAGEV